jgi:hypothetical protein
MSESIKIQVQPDSENKVGLTPEEIRDKNKSEQARAHKESMESFEQRVVRKGEFPPTDTEKRIGAYKEMLEPQVREAIVALVEKGYVTIDSGYAPREITDGVQYIGFEKGMIDDSLIPLILEKIVDKLITVNIKKDERSDYLTLKPQRFLDLEEWKEIWDSVVLAFPDRDEPAPFRERFIDKRGH